MYRLAYEFVRPYYSNVLYYSTTFLCRTAAPTAVAAAMAEATPSCGVCFEPYSERIVPRMLPCGHTFCEPCLNKMLRCVAWNPHYMCINGQCV